MLSALLIGLMFLSAFSKVAALVRIGVSRLAARYPLFTVMVVFSAARSIVLLAVGGWAGRVHPYREIFSATLAPSFAVEAAACLEGFWILALHFRNVKIFGSAMLIFFGAIGAAISYALIAVWAGWWTSPFLLMAILMERVALVLICIASLSLIFFRRFPTVPIRPNAIRHLGLLTLYFASQFLSGFFAQSAQYSHVFWANVFVNLGGATVFAAWAALIRPAGEELPFAAAPVLDDRAFEAADARDRRAIDNALGRGQASLEDLERETPH